MDISVITVTWNSKQHIGKQIASVQRAAKNVAVEQIVVDNASSDGTADYVAQNHSNLKLVRNTTNVGFAKANNQALGQASGEYLLFLNPDTEVTESSLETLVAYMRANPKVGILSLLLTTFSGEVNTEALPRRFPTWRDQAVILLKLHHIFPHLLATYLFKDINPREEQMVDSVRGSCMLVRRSLTEALGFAFDPRYFIWFEDVDICREAYRLGFKVMYVNSVKMVDYRGQSFKKQDMVKKQKQFFKSAIIYLKKWEPRYKSIILWIVQWFGIGGVWVYSKSGRKLKMKDAIER
jgi:GT2 family glycosyltransferase